MAVTDSFIRVPADSTGKRIRHLRMIDISVSSVLIDLDSLDEDTLITGATSLTTAKFKGYTVEEGNTILYVTSPTGDFDNGEDLEVDSSTIATVVTSTEFYTPINHISDHDTPENTWRIGNEGAGYIRFAEGNVTFDAFGYAQVSQQTVMRADTFLYGDSHAHLYSDLETGGGAVTASAITSQLKLSVDNVSGSRAARTSNLYFPYAPGEGNTAIFTVVVGDSGKAGCIRRWGMFDDEDGVYFQLSGSEFGVGIRTSIPGGTDKYAKQSEFNGTELATANIDPYVLDVTKYQIYWIDYQWLGVGKVRFGAWTPDGDRVVMHTFENANTLTIPYMKRGTLPWRLEIDNVGATSGISDVSMNCAAVLRQAGKFQLEGEEYTYHRRNIISVSGSLWEPLLSFRAPATFNGVTNRHQYMPIEYQVHIDGDAVEFHTFVNAPLSGSTWTEHTTLHYGSIELDNDASGSFSGAGLATTERHLFSGGTGTVEKVKFPNDTLRYVYGLRADKDPRTYTVSARCVKPTGTAEVNLLATWREIK